jgi:hypothetical protein
LRSRELAQWTDAFEFDRRFGNEGPDHIWRKVAALQSTGQINEAVWWIEVAAKLVRLCASRADQPN